MVETITTRGEKFYLKKKKKKKPPPLLRGQLLMNQRAWKSVIGCTTPSPTTLQLKERDREACPCGASASKLVHVVPSCLNVRHCCQRLFNQWDPSPPTWCNLTCLALHQWRNPSFNSLYSSPQTLSLSNWSWAVAPAPAPYHVSTCVYIYV